MHLSKLFPRFLVFICITPSVQVDRDCSPSLSVFSVKIFSPVEIGLGVGEAGEDNDMQASWALIQLAPSMTYLLTKKKSD